MSSPQITAMPAAGPPAAAAPQKAVARDVRVRAAVPAPAPPAPETPAGSANVEKVARQVAQTLRSLANDLEFSVDAESGRVLLRVRDKETQELIRQIPSEEMLAIADALDRLQGLLLKQTA